MKKTIFFSWQSDLASRVNRSFIQDCLDRAVRNLAKEELTLDYDVDRDTLDISGSPDIVASIFQKIESASIFVADVSFVHMSEKRRFPNPNVLVELGYAASAISWDNIICILNLETGTIEELPFDLRTRRILTYRLAPAEEDKSVPRKELVSKLHSAIRAIDDDLPRFAKRLTTLLDRINPAIVRHVQHGQRFISVNVTTRNEHELLAICQDPRCKTLATLTSNGCFMSNNTNSNGGINDIGHGTLSGYNIAFTDDFAQLSE